ncbi:hypothetical protein AB0424_17240 [Streptomyces sp. NPDC051180]|uniref:hypothetical protein n=1 Tax=Streptomyces sp. NPDC051180 TaxID=3155797 RepID=UPI00344F4C2F
MNEPQDTPRPDGPVFHGSVSRSQFAWNNETVSQNQRNDGTVAPGYEELAERVGDILRRLPEAGLAEQDRQEAREAAEEVLAEITGPEPVEPGRLRRALALLRGALATGVASGAAAGTQQWALEAIGGLTGIG